MESQKKEIPNWFTKHVDTVVVLAGILSCTLWITSQINSVDKRLTIIETVMVVKNIMPKELCKSSAQQSE